MSADEKDQQDSFASPPCFAHEVDPAYFGTFGTPAQKIENVAQWRSSERKRLLAERAHLSTNQRQLAALAVAERLDQLLASQFETLKGLIISAWWPIKAELDLRFWLAGLAARGATAALPLVVTRAAPLKFRGWTPETRLERGFWNILVPADGPYLVPDITLAPVVGWDRVGYRLGYGGGYFDRTLAVMNPQPLAIGIGLQSACLKTIYPQRHDVPMQAIITETGIAWPVKDDA